MHLSASYKHLDPNESDFTQNELKKNHKRYLALYINETFKAQWKFIDHKDILPEIELAFKKNYNVKILEIDGNNIIATTGENKYSKAIKDLMKKKEADTLVNEPKKYRIIM